MINNNIVSSFKKHSEVKANIAKNKLSNIGKVLNSEYRLHPFKYEIEDVYLNLLDIFKNLQNLQENSVNYIENKKELILYYINNLIKINEERICNNKEEEEEKTLTGKLLNIKKQQMELFCNVG